MSLVLISITEYWGESGKYADHTLGQYLVKKTKDFSKKLSGLRKVCDSYEDWNEVEEYVNNNFKVVDYTEKTIQIGE